MAFVIERVIKAKEAKKYHTLLELIGSAGSLYVSELLVVEDRRGLKAKLNYTTDSKEAYIFETLREAEGSLNIITDHASHRESKLRVVEVDSNYERI